MAIRVRKLAKELNRSPTEVLGVLHAIGFTRFRSVNDMLSDQIVARLKKAIRNNVTPLSVARASKTSISEKENQAPQRGQSYSESDLDLDLHQFIGAANPDAPPQERVIESSMAAPEEDVVSTLQAQIQILNAEKTHLESLFKRAVAELDELKALQRSEQENAVSYVSMASLLNARGLESERELGAAVQAIAALKPVGQWMQYLHVSDGASFSQWMAEKLKLVSSDSPSLAADGFAPVVVPIDRAEQPGDAAVRHAVQELSELFLLFGLRRILMVGDVSHYARSLRQHMDSRIQLQIELDRTRNSEEAERDVRRQDAVVLWNVETTEGARAIYDSSKAEVHHFTGDNLLRLRKEFQVSLDG